VDDNYSKLYINTIAKEQGLKQAKQRKEYE
jgi:hypothetical protein